MNVPSSILDIYPGVDPSIITDINKFTLNSAKDYACSLTMRRSWVFLDLLYAGKWKQEYLGALNMYDTRFLAKFEYEHETFITPVAASAFVERFGKWN